MDATQCNSSFFLLFIIDLLKKLVIPHAKTKKFPSLIHKYFTSHINVSFIFTLWFITIIITIKSQLSHSSVVAVVSFYSKIYKRFEQCNSGCGNIETSTPIVKSQPTNISLQKPETLQSTSRS